MSSSQRSSVYVHQASSGPSSRSSSGSPQYASPNSRAGSVRREYGADDRTATVSGSGNNLVINHRKRDYESGSPSPRYGGTYQ